MEIHEKLKHLTNEQIEEVIAMYQDKSVKISDIISTYHIDVKPGYLLKILPPIKTEEVCSVCQKYLYKHVVGRSSKNEESGDRFCLNCGHQEFSHTGFIRKVCECKACKEKLRLENERKKQLVREVYTRERLVMDFSQLQLEDQVKLIYLLSYNSYHNVSQIAPEEGNVFWISALNRLVEIDAISVSPQSAVSAFCEEDFPNRYYVDKVIYDVNIKFDDEVLTSINNNQYFLNFYSERELLNLFKKYIYGDLIEKFEEMLEKRGLQLRIFEDANDRFKALIDKISYTQILSLCNRVAIFFSDKVLTGEMNKNSAKNMVLSNVSKFYDRAMKLKWNLGNAILDCVGNELDFYISRVLNRDISILKDVVSIENFRKRAQKEKDYSEWIGM